MECSFKEIAELLVVCRLDVQGQFDCKFLSPSTAHIVSFRLKLHESLYGINPEPFKQGHICA